MVRALSLDLTLEAVPRARAHLRGVMAGSGLPDGVVDDTALVLSELVGNAVLHGEPPLAVVVEAADDGVLVSVRDGSRVAPVRPAVSPDAMTGRGLSLVQALSRDWGVVPSSTGKTVWAVVGVGGTVEDDAPAAPGELEGLLAAWDDDPDLPERFTVSLGDVPTDLLLDAKAHLDNLVREYVLAAGGVQAGTGAAVPADVAAMLDAVVHRFAVARHAVKRQALAAAARGESRTRLTVTLSLADVEAGEDYLRALDRADAYARDARLLTLQAPREHRLFRRWYVEALVSQVRSLAAGQVPEPSPTFAQRLRESTPAQEGNTTTGPRTPTLTEEPTAGSG